MEKKTAKKLYEKIITLLHPIPAGESSAPRKQQGLTSQELDPQIRSITWLSLCFSFGAKYHQLPEYLFFFFFFHRHINVAVDCFMALTVGPTFWTFRDHPDKQSRYGFELTYI